MAYKKIEEQLTESLETLVTYFKENRSVDVYEGLEERTQQINSNTREKIKFPEWLETLSEDEKEIVGYMWRIEATRRDYFSTSDEIRVNKIFVPRVNHEIIDFAKKVRNPN